MAIQMRRGNYGKLDPTKMLPGEWAIVQGEDPSATDGRSVYVAFAAGVVKRMATYTDMVDNCRDIIAQSIEDTKAKLTEKVEAAIAEVKATEAKLYPAAENVLKGAVKDTLVHVDDAFAGAVLREITVEGACRQDGTPSPDNPVPIEVVEHPVVRVTGRNLWSFASSYTSIKGREADFVRKGTPFTLLPGVYMFSTTGSLGDADAPLFGYTDTGKRFELLRIKRNASNQKFIFTVTESIASIYFVANSAVSNAGTISSIQLECNSTATEYKPYTSQALPFTLPAEHPFLAKIGDKADEITVDRDGTVELVARVGIDKDVRKVGDISQGSYYSLNTKLKPFASANDDYRGTMLCSAIPSKYDTSNGEGVYRTWNGVYVKDTSGRTKEEIQAEVDKNAPLTVVAVIPETRYPLGKIEMPTLPESTSNVWTDAEATPRTGIGYVRDLNIVVSNLESAIASIS